MAISRPNKPTDVQLVQALLDGDEQAFRTLVEKHHMVMVRVARGFVSSDSLAEEVVQETWLAILKGLKRFEGRSSLKTWMFRILTNRAKTRGKREGRMVPISSLGSSDDDSVMDADRFKAGGKWRTPPEEWGRTPESLATDVQTAQLIRDAVAGLPERQRLVITLRDLEGIPSAEVCNALDISETNQRVLLHRARTKVRSILEEYHEGASK